MHAGTRLLGFVVCVVLGAGCGGTSSTTTTSAPPSPSALFVTAAAENLILQPGDVGSGWFAIAKDTHTVSLADSMKGDSASLRKIEQASYRSGYQGLYADGKKDGVLIGAFTYNNPAVALQVADSWSARNAELIAHASLLHPPTSVVGGRVGMAGRDPPGASDGSRLHGHVVSWKHHRRCLPLWGQGVRRPGVPDRRRPRCSSDRGLAKRFRQNPGACARAGIEYYRMVAQPELGRQCPGWGGGGSVGGAPLPFPTGT